jgi:hypothetical protein
MAIATPYKPIGFANFGCVISEVLAKSKTTKLRRKKRADANMWGVPVSLGNTPIIINATAEHNPMT